MGKVKAIHDSRTALRTYSAAARSGYREDGGGISEHPPTVITGEPKQSNHDEHVKALIEHFSAPAKHNVELVMRDGEVVTKLMRLPAQNQCCVIDTIRLTMAESTATDSNEQFVLTYDDIARFMSQILHSIFGFGLTKKYDKGRDFFSDAWEIGDNYGHFAVGGAKQRDTMLVALNGQGCLAAVDGWELRLFEFLHSKCVRPKLTRVDLAHDDFDGSQITVREYDKLWEFGGFDRFGNRPEPGNYGSWKNDDPNNKGLTFYAGTKHGSQLFRGYEKGKQLGSPSSPWVRSEVQFSNHDRILPFDILINPSGYFVAAYPVLKKFSPETTPTKTAKLQKLAEAGVEHYNRHTKRSYGKFIRVGRQLFGDSEFLDMIQSDDDEFPKRLKLPDHRTGGTHLHKQPRSTAGCIFIDSAESDPGHSDWCSFQYDQ